MTATTQDLEAARLLLSRLGVDPADLVGDVSVGAVDGERPPMPTLGEWIPVVADLVSPSTASSYGSYWKKAGARWGERPMDTITATEIKAMAEHVRSTARVRRNSRGGRNAAENFIAAMRCLYKHLVNDGRLDERANPAMRVTKPRRNASTRRALASDRVGELNDIVSSTGDDPELDALVCWLHEESACRRGGALALRRRDLDQTQCAMLLREKGETERWQPASPTLMRHLVAHFDERGDGNPEGQLLRYANGNPITKRRYDYIFGRVQKELDWARSLQVSAHWLRHTTLTWVERNFGIGVARAFAGHAESGSDLTTTTYVKADITDKEHRGETPLFTIAHFVQYYNETYVGNPGTRAVAIPDCWLDHPGLVAEIATLAYTWREAHLGKKATPRDAQYWHDHWRTGFAERMATEWVHQRCRSDGHKTAGAPARLDRFTVEQREREARAGIERSGTNSHSSQDPLSPCARPRMVHSGASVGAAGSAT